jgi:X-X-X-Leu-X-X-Gly heptad repeat protein
VRTADRLADGADALLDGAAQLEDGANDLADGTRQLYEGTSDLNDGAQALDSGALDMAFMSHRDGSHEFRCIRKDPLLAILPPDHPYAKKKTLPAERFSEEPFIQLLPGHETDNAIYFRAHGVRPNIQFTSSDTMSGAAMVAAGERVIQQAAGEE